MSNLSVKVVAAVSLALALLVQLACSTPILSEASEREPAMSDTLMEFNEGEMPWRVVNDTVMGGVSRSGVGTTEAGTLLFEGTVSLENNGGFASCRADLGSMDLSESRGLAIRVRGDGQRYGFSLRDRARFDGVNHRVHFETTANEWETFEFQFSDFEAEFRGRSVPGASPLDTGRLRSLGLIISDKQEGAFRLEVDWIRTLW
jgi:monofunctional biosynthetic peptidoglycan transglycosylase